MNRGFTAALCGPIECPSFRVEAVLDVLIDCLVLTLGDELQILD